MPLNPLFFFYLLMIWFQTLHVFEEIACGAYKVGPSLKIYLIVASVLVTFNFVSFAMIALEWQAGYIMGLIASGLLGVGNGIIHLVGYLKTKSCHETIGAGVFTGIPLGVIGAIVFYKLILAM